VLGLQLQFPEVAKTGATLTEMIEPRLGLIQGHTSLRQSLEDPHSRATVSLRIWKLLVQRLPQLPPYLVILRRCDSLRSRKIEYLRHNPSSLIA
jgi:hypothetical protein